MLAGYIFLRENVFLFARRHSAIFRLGIYCGRCQVDIVASTPLLREKKSGPNKLLYCLDFPATRPPMNIFCPLLTRLLSKAAAL
jgi:hypothetical protein